jgi:hypothetical protein
VIFKLVDRVPYVSSNLSCRVDPDPTVLDRALHDAAE